MSREPNTQFVLLWQGNGISKRQESHTESQHTAWSGRKRGELLLCVSTVWAEAGPGSLPGTSRGPGVERGHRDAPASRARDSLSATAVTRPRTAARPRAGSARRLPAAHAEHELPLPPPPGCAPAAQLGHIWATSAPPRER